uniref:Tumor necrosis factor alpha-induced protein 8-like n=1 Tax=Phallusia mammillata TaxID=59560 RepID=A0A6F9DUL0_9ASCI|nr:tumor necrosis factor alpha-induced protein 8-like [Phallusia mammillata]
MGDEVKSKDFGLKAQKKILGKMASKSLTKKIIDEKTYDILDEFYKVRRQQTGNKKDAEKMLHNIIKVMIKVGVLEKNDRFSADEVKLAHKLQQKTKMAAMTIVSFYEVEFSFDKYVLSTQINEGRTILQQLVENHLTSKSKDRINSVFDILGDTEFLELLFEPNGNYKDSLAKIAIRLNELLDDGVL